MTPLEEPLSIARRHRSQIAGPGLLSARPGRERTRTWTCARELFDPTMENDTGRYRLSRQQGSGFE
jgi:hypothetical protein